LPVANDTYEEETEVINGNFVGEDDAIVDAVNNDLINLLEIDPYLTDADKVVEQGFEILSAIYESQSFIMIDEDEKEEIEYDQEAYIHLLESAFINQYEILQFLARMSLPVQLLESPMQRTELGDMKKFIFNTLVRPNNIGYNYPMSNEDKIFPSDSTFRASHEHEYEQLMKVMEHAPAGLKPGLKAYLERTVEYLFDTGV